jgi:glycosyltransferase involved in cell wall biosynthesis
MSNPLVSVLMTAYNREQYIAQAIESVLASSFRDFELIIVDDCSQDTTVAIAERYAQKDNRIRIYRNASNQGDYPNRNTAAGYARGKYLKYIDSDDMAYPHGLEVFVRLMEQFPAAALAFSSRFIQWNTSYPVFMDPQEALRTHFFKYGFLDTGPLGVMIRTDAFRECGGFSGVNMTGDSECWMRMARRFPVVIGPPGLIYWRIHDGQQYQEGLKNDTYLVQNFILMKQVFEESGDLLSGAEKEILIANNKREAVRNLLKRAIKTGRLGYYYKTYRRLGLSLADIRYLIVNKKG